MRRQPRGARVRGGGAVPDLDPVEQVFANCRQRRVQWMPVEQQLVGGDRRVVLGARCKEIRHAAQQLEVVGWTAPAIQHRRRGLRLGIRRERQGQELQRLGREFGGTPRRALQGLLLPGARQQHPQGGTRFVVAVQVVRAPALLEQAEVARFGIVARSGAPERHECLCGLSQLQAVIAQAQCGVAGAGVVGVCCRKKFFQNIR